MSRISHSHNPFGYPKKLIESISETRTGKFGREYSLKFGKKYFLKNFSEKMSHFVEIIQISNFSYYFFNIKKRENPVIFSPRVSECNNSSQN